MESKSTALSHEKTLQGPVGRKSWLCFANKEIKIWPPLLKDKAVRYSVELLGWKADPLPQHWLFTLARGRHTSALRKSTQLLSLSCNTLLYEGIWRWDGWVSLSISCNINTTETSVTRANINSSGYYRPGFLHAVRHLNKR